MWSSPGLSWNRTRNSAYDEIIEETQLRDATQRTKLSAGVVSLGSALSLFLERL
jgi:hypothetical protein